MIRSLIAAPALLLLAGPAGAAEYIVQMSGMNYSPAKLTAKVGDTIRFVNDDSNTHDVFVPTRGFGVDLGAQKAGASTELKLLRPGRFEVECVLHSHMTMLVEVGQ
jgi:plastocyanin